MDLGPLPGWKLDECRRKLAGLLDLKSFDTMNVNSRNLVVYDRRHFEPDTALGA